MKRQVTSSKGWQWVGKDMRNAKIHTETFTMGSPGPRKHKLWRPWGTAECRLSPRLSPRHFDVVAVAVAARPGQWRGSTSPLRCSSRDPSLDNVVSVGKNETTDRSDRSPCASEVAPPVYPSPFLSLPLQPFSKLRPWNRSRGRRRRRRERISNLIQIYRFKDPYASRTLLRWRALYSRPLLGERVQYE